GRAERYVFQVRSTSQHVKFRNETPFLALLPEDPPGAGLMSITGYVSAVGAKAPDYTQPYWHRKEYTPIRMLMAAQLVYFDRDNMRAVVDLWDSFSALRRDLINCGALDFNVPLMLVEREGIPILKQVKDVAIHIGNPSNAVPAPETAEALVKLKRRSGRAQP